MGEHPGQPMELKREDELKLVDYASKRVSIGLSFGMRQFMKYFGIWELSVVFHSRMVTIKKMVVSAEKKAFD